MEKFPDLSDLLRSPSERSSLVIIRHPALEYYETRATTIWWPQMIHIDSKTYRLPEPSIRVNLDGEEIGTIPGDRATSAFWGKETPKEKIHQFHVQAGRHFLLLDVKWSDKIFPLGKSYRNFTPGHLFFDIAPKETVEFHCRYESRGKDGHVIKLWREGQ